MSSDTRARRSTRSQNGRHLLRLYVAGSSAKSIAAFRNLKELCEQHLPGRYKIEVIDLTKQPHLARSDQVLAVPTVVRRRPPPIRKIIGNLSDAQRVLTGLDLRPQQLNPFAAGKKEKHAR